MATALNVANNILQRAFEEDIDITPMKLQKLIYFVYKRFLQQTSQPLFSERFETWKYGPVLSSVYDEFKHRRANAIREYAHSNGDKALKINEKKSPEFSEAINYVWEKYKNIDGLALSAMTHKKGTAWSKAYKANKHFLDDDDIMSEVDNG